jgi:hypothetical protein
MPQYETLFPTLPDSARVWIYTADHHLGLSEQSALLDSLRPFLAQWTSHGRRVIGEALILEGRLLIVAATLAEGDISGCGIDASTHAVEEAGRALGIEWLLGLTVLYRDHAGMVQVVSRPEFRDLVRRGVVHAGTQVIDTNLTTLEDLHSGKLEKLAGASWHGRTFQIHEPAA